jgi:AmiR/NasT family two-component response regulator
MPDVGQEAAARILALEKALDEALAEVAQLEQAIESRDVIGQAKGVLMERHQTGPDEAFAELCHRSQTLNVKLREIAARVSAEPSRD